MRTDTTALIVPLLPLQTLLQPFLLEHIRSPAAQVPPHITLHVPFLPLISITSKVLDDIGQLCAVISPFAVRLATFKRFPLAGVVYLQPEPTEPFLELSRAIQRRYPEAPPDFPDPVMHLTLAYGYAATELDNIEHLFTQLYSQHLPLEAEATTVSLYVKQDNIWREHLIN